MLSEGEGDSAGVGKAKVGVTSGVGDSSGEAVALGDGVGAGVGDGVAVGVGIKFSHRCSATVAPPISSTNFSQRARIFARSGGPKGLSAVPGKIR
jgi:hypothetical protein